MNIVIAIAGLVTIFFLTWIGRAYRSLQKKVNSEKSYKTAEDYLQKAKDLKNKGNLKKIKKKIKN